MSIVGQGYVGVSLACAAADAGFRAIGIDVDRRRIEELRRGTLSVPGVDERLFHAGIASGRVTFTSDTGDLGQSDVILICVPTPVRDGTPNLSYVERACEEVARGLRRGQLIVLESTTYPGTTDDLVCTLLEVSGLVAGRDFLLAYSPERIDPGNAEFTLRNTPKVVGGHTGTGARMAALFYEQIVEKVVVVSSTRAAELSKLLENTFRHVNVALVNEMAILCEEMGIDVWEVLDAAATKPFGFMPFYPGPGVGGHCIPLDPAYLAWQVRRDAGRRFRILEQAQEINGQMPEYVAARIGHALNDVGKAVRGARVLVLGVAYKPDVGDIRESPAVSVMAHLRKRGADVAFHDPYVDAVQVNGAGLERTGIDAAELARSDCVAILTPHSTYDLDAILGSASLIFDARNAFGEKRDPRVVRL